MERIVIEGGIPLRGCLRVNGAKNSAVALLAAAALTDEEVILDNLPEIADVFVMIEILQAIGMKVTRRGAYEWHIAKGEHLSHQTPSEVAVKLRASYYFLGSLLAKKGKVNVALPGGCQIGARPIDQHLKGFQAMNAKYFMEDGQIKLHTEHLKGGHVFFDMSTVGATINVMLAASMADGVTIMENAALEPEVIDVANFINAMGGSVRGAGTETIRVTGVQRFGGCVYSCIPDRIEAGTFLFAAAASGGDVTLSNVIPEHLDAVIAKLRETGLEVRSTLDTVRVIGKDRGKAVNIKTLPHPGFPTDLQAPAMAFMGLAEGTSIFNETIFEARFGHAEELNSMGANIKVDGQTAMVQGVQKYKGAPVHATNLRAGACLVIAGLAAHGTTYVSGVEHIDRGYDRIVERLHSLGAKIRRETV
jgi:UDP-N-acetylglucosamine 1-carboxyvinyltransferase